MSNEMQGAPQRETQDAPKPSTLLDRSDIRVKHATGISGAAFSYQIAATNSPTSFAATGLPAGLSVNASSGLISGTVSASGTTFQTVLRGIMDAGMDKIPILTSAANMETALLAPWAKAPPAQLTFNGPRFWGTSTDPDPRVRAAIASYHAAFKRVGAEPTPNDEFYWDPAQIAVDAYRHLGTAATAAQVHDYIENLHDFAGIAGVYDFRSGDQHGLGDDATVILQWDAAKSTFFPVSAPGGVALGARNVLR